MRQSCNGNSCSTRVGDCLYTGGVVADRRPTGPQLFTYLNAGDPFEHGNQFIRAIVVGFWTQVWDKHQTSTATVWRMWIKAVCWSICINVSTLNVASFRDTCHMRNGFELHAAEEKSMFQWRAFSSMAPREAYGKTVNIAWRKRVNETEWCGHRGFILSNYKHVGHVLRNSSKRIWQREQVVNYL